MNIIEKIKRLRKETDISVSEAKKNYRTLSRYIIKIT